MEQMTLFFYVDQQKLHKLASCSGCTQPSLEESWNRIQHIQRFCRVRTIKMSYLGTGEESPRYATGGLVPVDDVSGTRRAMHADIRSKK